MLRAPYYKVRAGVLAGIFMWSLIFGGFNGSAIAQEQDLQTPSYAPGTGEGVEARKEELRTQLEALQAEIAQLKETIREYQGKKEGLAQELSILESKIYKTQLQIRQLNLAIEQTDVQIVETEQKINDTTERIASKQEHVAVLLRRIYEQDDTNFLELVLTYDTFSDFFDRVESVQALEEGVRDVLLGLKETKVLLEEQQEELGNRQQEQEQLRGIQYLQRQDLAGQRGTKESLLKETQGKEAEYRKLEKERQKTAAEIRNQLFVLEGAGVAINFGDAYMHAVFASNLTGVRPAFLLAVLKRESSWGANVGQCYLVDPETGMGKGKNSGEPYPRTMKPSRDVQPFLQITQELGRDPYNTPVSCPHPDYGFGGAMGPAQFIPSTWIAHQDQVAEVLGYMPDPWRIRDAFVASAVKLAQAGAASQNPDIEWKAAMIYYAGGNWNNSAYWGYADWIMDRAAEYQAEIDILLTEK